MMEQLDITNVLFFDIETVSSAPAFDDLGKEKQDLWSQKAKWMVRKDPAEMTGEDLASSYSDRAAIYAEFGKIVCISAGFMVRDPDDKINLRVKSFYDHDEQVILEGFSELLNKYYTNPSRHYLCGHNIREFDVPYICRRMVVHQMKHPELLKIHGKKPWELNHLLDTMQLWKFGDVKHFTSLKLLASTLGFPSPKDDIDGSEVGRVYWEEKDLERIATYCEKDVLATAQLLFRFLNRPLLSDEQVSFVGR